METIIAATAIRKAFKIKKRDKRVWGCVRSLFFPQYKIKKAVDGISFQIAKGEIVGFIGPNGAGKSTTIKMLSGILYPDEGEIIANGYIPYKKRKEYVARIGVVFGQKSQLIWDLPVIDSFELLKSIYKIPGNVYIDNLNKFTRMLDMEDFIEQPVRQLSLGQRMRAEIVAALLHSPDILFLDEPTIGLDVVAKKRIRDFVKYVNKEQQTTIIFTTHDMRDIEEVCERIIMIDKGKKIFDGTQDSFRHKYMSKKMICIELAEDITIEPIQNVNIIKIGSQKYVLSYSPTNISINCLITELVEKYQIIDLVVQDEDIEQIVRNIYGEGK